MITDLPVQQAPLLKTTTVYRPQPPSPSKIRASHRRYFLKQYCHGDGLFWWNTTIFRCEYDSSTCAARMKQSRVSRRVMLSIAMAIMDYSQEDDVTYWIAASAYVISSFPPNCVAILLAYHAFDIVEFGQAYV